MAADALDTIRSFLNMLAVDRHPGAQLFATTARRDVPEAGVRAGDTVVYANAAPAPTQAIVWSTDGGKPQVGRLESGGRLRSASAAICAERVRGVVVAVITQMS